jgi:uncharacterized protein
METIPDEFWDGIEQFNQGEYYACHDTLEAIWIEAPTSDKNFYQGILQIAVALYHLGNGNWRGCVILMGEGLNRLQKYESDYGGIDVDQFAFDTADLLLEVQNIGSDRARQITFQPTSDPDLIFLQPLIIQKA